MEKDSSGPQDGLASRALKSKKVKSKKTLFVLIKDLELDLTSKIIDNLFEKLLHILL